MEHILDPKLLSHLHHSNQVQSQLKLSIQQFSGGGESNTIQRKSSLFRLSDGPTTTQNRDVGDSTANQSKQNDRQLRDHLMMLLKLMDEAKIMSTMKSFLSTDAYQIILASYKARKKTARGALKSAIAPTSKLRIFQDDVLYTGYYASNDDDFDERTDMADVDLLKFDIEQFTEQRDRLIRDNHKCAYFLRDERSSEWMEYKYLAMKLQYARQCATATKNQGKAGQYLAKLLDLRNDLMNQCEQQRGILEISLENLQSCRDKLTEDLVQYSKSLKDIDHAVISEAKDKLAKIGKLSANERLKLKSHRSQFTDEEKFQLFEERLHKIVQLLKPPTNVTNHMNSNPTATTASSPTKKGVPKQSSDNMTENQANLSSKKFIDTVLTNTSVELKAFQADAQARMDSCYQLALRSLKKRDATRQAILQGIKVNDSEPDRFRDKLLDLTARVSNQECLLDQATKFRKERREELYTRHLQDLKHPEALITQHRVQCMNRLKAEYSNIFAKAQAVLQEGTTVTGMN